MPLFEPAPSVAWALPPSSEDPFEAALGAELRRAFSARRPQGLARAALEPAFGAKAFLAAARLGKLLRVPEAALSAAFATYLDFEPLREELPLSTPVQIAMEEAGAVGLRAALAAGFSPSEPNGAGVVPLVSAAASGLGACVNILLSAGADLSASAPSPFPPLPELLRRTGLHDAAAAAEAEAERLAIESACAPGKSAPRLRA